jgi:hypothetical protein
MGEDIALVDRAGNEAGLDFDELSKEQQLIMAHLAKRALKLDEDNFATVARHELEFVRRRD